MTVPGVTGGAALTEMIALGAMDSYLVKGATVTFFRFRYSKHTNFAMESIYQPFASPVGFGSEAHVNLNRNGDLIYFIYVVIDLPGIMACRRQLQGCGVAPPSFPVGGCAGFTAEDQDAALFTQPGSRARYMKEHYGACVSEDCENSDSCSSPGDEEVWVHWCNAVGQKIINTSNLVVGNHLSDTLYSDYLYLWEELSGKAGKRLKEMIAKRTSRKQLIRDAKSNQRLFVPLPYYFTMTSGNALPLVTLQNGGVQIHVKFEELKNLLVVSHDDCEVIKCADGRPLENSDLRAVIDTTYIYLDVDERTRFANANFDQLSTQVQQHKHTSYGGNIRVALSFNHPIIELIWAIRRRVNEQGNNWFNYSGIDGRDPIENVVLRLNNSPRFAGRPGAYYRLVQPYQHHSSIPECHAYCYSFALDPEKPQPTGSCNFSRIDHVEMEIETQEGLQSEYVTTLIYARNWNIMRFIGGVGGNIFHN